MAGGVPLAPDSDGQRGGGGARALGVLLAQTAAGDADAFRTLYDRTGAKLFGIILRIVADETEAEAVLQDVYVTVWRKAATFEPGSDAQGLGAMAWVAAIARGHAIDRVRSRAHAASALPTLPAAPLPMADAGLVPGQDARRLDGALARLDPRHAAAIRACYLDGTGYGALAQRNGVAVDMVKAWVRRGLIRVRAKLEGGA